VQQINEWLNYIGLLILAIVVFAVGFYFGTEYTSDSQQKNNHTINSDDFDRAAETIEKKEVVALEVEGVYWIKAGEEPICPEDHPIKGKFDPTANVFYTKENKSYNRVKPHVCFATEEFAETKAGFIKKY
jgi:hypothetical protein